MYFYKLSLAERYLCIYNKYIVKCNDKVRKSPHQVSTIHEGKNKARERELLGAKGRLLLKQEGRGDLLEQVTSEETPKQGREGVAQLPGEKKRNAEPPSSLTCSSRFKP